MSEKDKGIESIQQHVNQLCEEQSNICNEAGKLSLESTDLLQRVHEDLKNILLTLSSKKEKFIINMTPSNRKLLSDSLEDEEVKKKKDKYNISPMEIEKMNEESFKKIARFNKQFNTAVEKLEKTAPTVQVFKKFNKKDASL
ncbi:MAG: hypothetical protein IPP77_00605 [Bacteroidetes bacterium]|nr:hypothetical protein [Bacteroidota bacterium]